MRISKNSNKTTEVKASTKFNVGDEVYIDRGDLPRFIGIVDSIDGDDIIIRDWRDDQVTYRPNISKVHKMDLRSTSDTDKALQHIKAAIDILGKSGNKDSVTKDSIANLATVMFDIKASTVTAASKCKYSKKECIDAIQDQYGKNKKEAEEYYKSADAKTLEALVDGFKGNAKKTFYDD